MKPPTIESRFSPLMRITRRHLLPVPGTVLVRVGDRVGPNDVIAQAAGQGSLCIVDIAFELDLSPKAALRAICVRKGQSVERGEPLAIRRGLTASKRRISAPYSGTVQAIIGSQVFLRQNELVRQLKAYIPGAVSKVYPHQGVAIETNGALIRGVWGSGAQRDGRLVTMVTRARDELTWDQIGLRYRGTIVVGGFLSDPRVLFRARQFQLHGLIVGSILSNLRPQCEQSPLPVVVTEGVGTIPMAEPIFNLLRSCHGRPAVISGGSGSHTDPEVIIPLGARIAASELGYGELSVGTHVRLTRPPYLGLLGQIVDTFSGPQETAIGSHAEGGQVRLADGRKLFVPFSNLEPLE